MLKLAVAIMMLAYSNANAAPDISPRESLVATDFLNHQHPAIQAVITELWHDDAVTMAVRLHNFVRDEIRFGWTRRFYAMKASDVLRARAGYCNTKSTLFVALLRGAGIPARQRFVNINADILKPFVNLPQRYVDHSYTEVFLDSEWHAVDSYIPHPELFAKAQALLLKEGNAMGYGVHRLGTNRWDGRSNAFAQFVDRDPNISTTDYGYYTDTQHFYAAAERSESLVGLRRFVLPIAIAFSDGAVERFTR